MNMKSAVSTSLFLVTATSLFFQSQCFLGIPPSTVEMLNGNPSLTNLVKNQEGHTLNIVLDIPEDPFNPEDSRASRLVIDGMRIELESEPIKQSESGRKTKKNSKYPPSKSDLFGLKILSEGNFISKHGKQTVEFDDASWHMTWLENSLTGALTCKFHLDKEARRNDAALPAGQVCITFPIFCKESLGVFQARSDEYNLALDEYYRTQHKQLDEMEKTRNPIKKAMLFTSTVGKYEAIMRLKETFYNEIPTKHTIGDAVFQIGNEVLVAKGKVWTEDSKCYKGIKLLGFASLKASDE